MVSGNRAVPDFAKAVATALEFEPEERADATALAFEYDPNPELDPDDALAPARALLPDCCRDRPPAGVENDLKAQRTCMQCLRDILTKVTHVEQALCELDGQNAPIQAVKGESYLFAC